VQKQLMNHFLQIRFDPPRISNSGRQTQASLMMPEDTPRITDARSMLLKTDHCFEKDHPKISDFRMQHLTNKSETCCEDPPRISEAAPLKASHGAQPAVQPAQQPIDCIEWRNDYRKQNEISREETGNGLTRFIHYLLSPPKITPPLPEFTYDLSRTLRWCILLAYELNIISPEFYDAFATLANPDNQTEHTHDLLPIQNHLFTEIRAKFDAVLAPI
jgi:hypothetical protein